ncbi:hypothetical protein BJ546DRAFT_949772 [Cryomyces antarcticus]
MSVNYTALPDDGDSIYDFHNSQSNVYPRDPLCAPKSLLSQTDYGGPPSAQAEHYEPLATYAESRNNEYGPHSAATSGFPTTVPSQLGQHELPDPHSWDRNPPKKRS